MNTQIIPLVEQAVVERLRAQTSFTALDVSNALKSDRYPVTHGEVAEIVRDIYATGAMGYYDYRRKLINVITDSGAKKVQTFLYLHDSVKEREYTARCQNSLPRVPSQAVRDLADSVPAGPTAVLPRPPRPSRVHGMGRRGKQRRDGALAIPRTLVNRLGWTVGMSLGLTIKGGAIRLTQNGDVPVRVWDGQRVRISKRKLRSGALVAGQVTLSIEGDGLTLKARA